VEARRDVRLSRREVVVPDSARVTTATPPTRPADAGQPVDEAAPALAPGPATAPSPATAPAAAATAAATVPEPAVAEHPDWRTSLRFERVVFFSDAVMAIAITLLLVDIRPPQTDDAGYEAALLAMLRHPEPFIAVAIGFYVLGSYWMSHRAIFALLVRSSSGVLWANLLFLFGVAIQPFFTMALAAHVPNAVSVAAYAACQVFTGLALWSVWLLALRRSELLAPSVTARRRRFIHLQLVRGPIIFGLSIAVATLVSPSAGMVAWAAAIPVAIVTARLFPDLGKDPDATVHRPADVA
jgi:uncharacterized membrane protein